MTNVVILFSKNVFFKNYLLLYQSARRRENIFSWLFKKRGCWLKNIYPIFFILQCATKSKKVIVCSSTKNHWYFNTRYIHKINQLFIFLKKTNKNCSSTFFLSLWVHMYVWNCILCNLVVLTLHIYSEGSDFRLKLFVLSKYFL